MKVPDGPPRVEAVSNRDPEVALDQVQLLAEMNGIFLRGHAVTGLTREGRFYEPSWWWWDRLEGKYWISKELIRFWPTSRPRNMSLDSVYSRLAFVGEDLTNLSLRKLENGYDRLKRNLQRTTSIRDTWLALMKSLPYVIITLLVALFAASVYTLATGRLTVNSEALFASIVLSVIFIGLLVISYFETSQTDGSIATLGIWCDKVQSIITERRNRIMREFERLTIKPPMNPTQYNISFEDVVRTNKVRMGSLKSSFGEDLSKDIEYGLPLVSQKVDLYSQALTSYKSELESFQRIAKESILETSKTGGFETPNAEKMSDLLRALYLVCSGIVGSESDFEHEKERGLNDSTHLVQEYLSLGGEPSGYGKLAENEGLVKKARDAQEKFRTCEMSFHSMKDTIRFVFGGH